MIFSHCAQAIYYDLRRGGVETILGRSVSDQTCQLHLSVCPCVHNVVSTVGLETTDALRCAVCEQRSATRRNAYAAQYG